MSTFQEKCGVAQHQHQLHTGQQEEHPHLSFRPKDGQHIDGAVGGDPGPQAPAPQEEDGGQQAKGQRPHYAL